MNGTFYGYTKVVYQGNKSMIVVTCPKHGDFKIRANNHLLGVGCKLCGIEHVADCARMTFNEAEKRCGEAHSHKYKYIKTDEDVTGQKFKLSIMCTVHGIFKCAINNHLQGKGCPNCAIESTRMSQEYFDDKASKLVREVIYDYSEAVVTDSKSKIKITCPLHGAFTQTAASHLQGNGCPSCALSGYKSNKPGNFYVLRDGDITKIGITNNAVSRRVRVINRSGKSFTVVAYFHFENGQHARDLENKFLKRLRATHSQPAEKFDGSTECFYEVDIDDLLSEIQLTELT